MSGMTTWLRSGILDRIGHPQADASGVKAENNDYRLNVSLGLKF